MPYSLSDSGPNYTNLILTDSATTTLNPWTKYSLLQTDTLDLAIADSSDPSAISFGLKIIFVYNSSLSIQKVNLDSEYSNIETDNRFVYPIECGAGRSINFDHIDSKISGSFLSSISAVEVNLNNINFDAYRASYCVSIFAP